MFSHMACVAENKRENKQSNKNEGGNQNEKQEKKSEKQNQRDHNAVNADCLYSRNDWLLVSFRILRRVSIMKIPIAYHELYTFK